MLQLWKLCMFVPDRDLRRGLITSPHSLSKGWNRTASGLVLASTVFFEVTLSFENDRSNLVGCLGIISVTESRLFQLLCFWLISY